MYTIMLMTLSLSATAEIPDGSLLVLRNSNKPVARFTGSDVTHVAMIFHHGETEWVYEATPAKARRLKLADYKRELGEGKPGSGRVSGVSLLKPKSPYSESQIERMRSHAASQIGRRYSVKGYVREKEFDGIHCAHLVAATLEAGGRFQFDQEYAISPGELVASIRNSHETPVQLTVEANPSNDSWCKRSWTTWFNYGAWCRWASYETWTFCW